MPDRSPRPRVSAYRRSPLACGLGWSLALGILAPNVYGAAFTPGAEPDPATGEAPVASGEASQAAEPLRGNGIVWRFAPWSQVGLVSVDGRWMRLHDGRVSRQAAVIADMEWASYVWQPWFIQVRFGIGGLASRDSSSGGETDASVTRGEALTGRLGLSLFPMSRFPFELRADVGDTRATGDTFGSDMRTRRLSLSQSYRPEVGSTNAQFSLEHSRLEANSVRDSLTALQATVQHHVDAHDLEAGASFATNHRSDGGSGSKVAALSLRHGFHPASGVLFDSLASWNQQRLSDDDPRIDGIGTEARQISTVMSWRPLPGQPLHDPERPVVVAGSARWLESRLLGSDRRRVESMSASAGSAVDLNRTWRVNVLAAAGRSRSSGTEHISQASGSMALSFSPASIALADWRYSPSASLGVGLSRVTRVGTQHQESVQGMQAVSREWALGDGHMVSFSLTQGGSAQAQSRLPGTTRSLSHSLGLYWQASSEAGGQRMAGLSFSDGRSFGQLDSQAQLANLQLSQRTSLSRFSSWSLNLTAQASRNQVTHVDPGLIDVTPQHQGNWQRFYAGSLSFDQQRLFGVPRLRHSLHFSFNSQQIERRSAGDIDAPRERVSHLLESRIGYDIGRLGLRFVARMAKVEGRVLSVVQLRMQRGF